jgi:intracellular septation protein A
VRDGDARVSRPSRLTVVVSAPSFKQLMRGGGPRFLRDAFGPPVAFYAGFKLDGLVLGVAFASAWTLVAYTWERRHGRPGVAARIGLAIAIVQAIVGLVSRSAIGYFAPPVIANAIYGLAFVISVAIRRPLAAVFAVEMYPIPAELRVTREFRRTFSLISLAWGVYLLGRSILRMFVLTHYSVDVYVAVNVATATPLTLALMMCRSGTACALSVTPDAANGTGDAGPGGFPLPVSRWRPRADPPHAHPPPACADPAGPRARGASTAAGTGCP